MVICCCYWSCRVYNDFALLRVVMKKHILLFILLIVVALPVEAQCAMCRAVLESEDGKGAAEGINNGIMYLMAIPYILVAGIAFVIFKKFNTSKTGDKK